MRTIILFKVFILLFLVGSFFSCSAEMREKTEDNSPQSDVYYVVGYDGSSEVDSQEGKVKSGGYTFISENLKDSLLANNRFLVEGENSYRFGDLLDGIVDFPIEAMVGGCGFTFFPEEYRFAFKVQINSYRPMTEEEERDVPRLVNAFCYSSCDIRKFKCITITSISKIQY